MGFNIMRRKRLDLGLTQVELAAVSGVAKDSIRRIERDLRKRPTFHDVVKLARALDLPMEVVASEALPR